jgi:hypothetical protein
MLNRVEIVSPVTYNEVSIEIPTLDSSASAVPINPTGQGIIGGDAEVVVDIPTSGTDIELFLKLSLSFVFIDMLCVPKFIILPIVMISMFGGPPLVTTLPWVAWGMISSCISLLFSTSNMTPKHIFLWIWTTSRKDLSVVNLVWSILDGILSLVNIGICLVMIIVVFPEPDGRNI